MHKLVLTALLGALFFSASPNKQSQSKEDQHPIDSKYEQCLLENGELSCLSSALEDWDKELNLQYQCLKSSTSPSSFEKLKASQISWIEHRDKEFRYIKSLYEDSEGSMYPLIILRFKIAVVKNRALELEKHCKAKSADK